MFSTQTGLHLTWTSLAETGHRSGGSVVLAFEFSHFNFLEQEIENECTFLHIKCLTFQKCQQWVRIQAKEVKSEPLCPSCKHVQPPNCTPPAFSPHYPETLRSRDPIYQSLLPIHLLSQMHYRRLHKSIHHLRVVRSFSFIPLARSTTLFPTGRTAGPYVADDYNRVPGWQQQPRVSVCKICNQI